jgi:hypothetical protein
MDAMSPNWNWFALGLLVGAAKVMTIGTVAFGIAWWRARRRVRELEAEQVETPIGDARLDRIEQGLDLLAAQLERVARSQEEITQQLGKGPERRLPLGADSPD